MARRMSLPEMIERLADEGFGPFMLRVAPDEVPEELELVHAAARSAVIAYGKAIIRALHAIGLEASENGQLVEKNNA